MGHMTIGLCNNNHLERQRQTKEKAGVLERGKDGREIHLGRMREETEKEEK